MSLHSDSGKQCVVNALLDEGSSVSRMSSAVAEKLGRTLQLDPVHLRWTDGSVQEDASSLGVSGLLGPVDDQKSKFSIN